MIKTGIDLVVVERIKSLYNRKKFGEHMLCQSEVAYIEKKSGIDAVTKQKILPYDTIAGFYVAKESVSKALGIGFSKGLNFSDIEICHTLSNAPYVVLKGLILKVFTELGGKDISISISHDGGFAMAVCTILC